jgi:hypothetical protein
MLTGSTELVSNHPLKYLLMKKRYYTSTSLSEIIINRIFYENNILSRV